ncbi:synthetase [Cyanidiococcus yangmingshanensis]|uniref:acetate--CoA ligase n=1 Tax=Cyanidiococcus yangmingshanensis TaxID=2690220 RepID=A0A7J7IIF2_9RHOD|nr:synthetase [Cyanidiococcus yangmingshanensis]
MTDCTPPQVAFIGVGQGSIHLCCLRVGRCAGKQASARHRAGRCGTTGFGSPCWRRHGPSRLWACAYGSERPQVVPAAPTPMEGIDPALARTLVAEGVPASSAHLLNSPSHIPDYATYCELYTRSVRDPAGFWLDMAKEHFVWRAPEAITPDSVLRYNFDVRRGPIQIEWFFRAETNICYNALDRHVERGLGNRVAYYYEANDTDDVDAHRAITYAELLDSVKRIARVLRQHGVRRGDTVTIYMPMVPELPAAMLACARIGAVHNVVFGGFSAEALAGRLLDARSAVILSCDGVRRGAKRII